jgi:hypothetical protein
MAFLYVSSYASGQCSNRAGEVVGFNICAYNAKHYVQNTGIEEQQILFLTFLKNFRTLKTKLHGFLQNSARPKKVCEKTSETSAGQRSLGGV